MQFPDIRRSMKMYFRKVIIPVALAGICAAAPAGFRIEIGRASCRERV